MNAHAWICYDGGCALCRRWIGLLRPHVRRRGFRCAALQRPAVRRRLGIAGRTPDEFKLLLPDGSVVGGADAALRIAAALDWARPLVWLARALGLRPALRRLYRAIARHRHCHAGLCAPRPTRRAARKRAFDAAWIGALAGATRASAWR